MRRYTDEQFAAAIPAARSWRGVLQSLGLKGTSAGSLRSVRRHADQLGLDYTHFTGQRRWSDQQLRTAVAGATSWVEVINSLGLSDASGTSRATLRGHALRLNLDTAHLDLPRRPAADDPMLHPTLGHLSRAAPLMAAAWFEMCGCRVSWPLEPCRYDLLIWRNGSAERIQVKTTTRRIGSSWNVQLRTNRKHSHTYTPDEIDHFFIVDGDYTYYFIPLKVVGGFSAINLSAYTEYKVPTLTG